MDKSEQFDFLKNYYELLKSKDAHNIGGRFTTQAKQLTAAGEIDPKVLNIITAAIAIGKEMGKDLTSEDFGVIKEFINIGVEIKEEEAADSLAQTLARNAKMASSSRSTPPQYTPDPCSRGSSSTLRSRC